MEFIRKSPHMVIGKEDGNSFVLTRKSKGRKYEVSFKDGNNKPWIAYIVKEFKGEDGIRLADSIFEMVEMDKQEEGEDIGGREAMSSLIGGREA